MTAGCRCTFVRRHPGLLRMLFHGLLRRAGLAPAAPCDRHDGDFLGVPAPRGVLTDNARGEPMTILRHLAVLAAAFWISTASAQSPPAHESIDLAPVTLDGHSLFTVRGASSMPERDRAAGIRTRIVEAARDEKFDPADIQVVEMEEMSQIRAGQRVFLHVFNADAELEAVDHHALALVHAERIRVAIADWRSYRQPERVRAGIRTSAIAIGALAVFLVVFLWITKRLV